MDKLDNPVYHALLSGDRNLGRAEGNVVFFDDAVSPFAGFDDHYNNGFADLHTILPAGRLILYATPRHISRPAGWRLLAKVRGVQMLYNMQNPPFELPYEPLALTENDVPQMLELTQLTRPGPFGQRTCEFGNYHGIFANGALVAMTGQRLHIDDYTEISAVCTHPDHIGKGYASVLLKHQVNAILAAGQKPFLHVRADNERAIQLYKRLGFSIRSAMNFYFMLRVNKRKKIVV